MTLSAETRLRTKPRGLCAPSANSDCETAGEMIKKIPAIIQVV